MNVKTKTCLPVSRGGCGMEYPLEEFHKEKGGRKPRCKLCQSRWVQMTASQRKAFMPEQIAGQGDYRIIRYGVHGYQIRKGGAELGVVESRDEAEAMVAVLVRHDELAASFLKQRPTRCERAYQSIGLALA